MELEEYKLMYELEDHHWWFRGRLLMTEGLLARYILPHYAPRRPRLLDLGCGTGLWLERRAADCDPFGLDFSRAALTYCHQRGLRRIVQADAGRLPVADASVDVVSAFDLIEHVEDDAALIAEIWRVLRPGGFLLASVPAHPLLWTGHDVSLHHHRRYRGRQFEALFAHEHWERLRMTSAFTLIFPPAAAIRLTRRLLLSHRPAHSDAHITSDWFNRLMIGLHRGEAAWLRRWDLPFGISFLTLRRKR